MMGKGWGSLPWALVLVACATGHGRDATGAHATSNPNQLGLLAVSEAPTAMYPAVRTGKLANGLTYYVLEHRKPEHRAALWLAVDAGSLLEDDDQLGLAHFVEHMAFNGTKRFPRLAIANFMENAGMVFGPDLNATTTVDETLYQLTVPTDAADVLLKGFDFLHDVVGDISFDAAAVERERAVLLEEWRMRRGAAARVRERELPVLLRGSRYANRTTMLPGLVESATPAVLSRFYHDWYRPDSMAVIAVGDFDGASIEREIKARFADLAEPAKPRPHIAVSESLKQEPLVSVGSDAEQQRTVLSTFEKVEHRHRHSQADFRRELVERLYLSILSERWAELRDDPDSPWVEAKTGRYKLNRALDFFSNTITSREGRFEDSVSLLFRESSRISQFGFLPSELERASKRALTDAERMMLESPSSPLAPLASEITRNFLEREEMPGPALELAWTRQIVPSISLDEVNALAREHAQAASRVITIHAPTNVGLPTTERIQTLVQEAAKARVAQWREVGPEGPLLLTPPLAGPVLKTEHDAAADATVWTLANGIRVVVKP
ncbi:MAG TPA: pitrilysin family protein, partial [Polyangiaceae bacterium]